MWVLLFLASASSASPTPFDDARWISPKGSVANGTFAAYRTTVVPRSGPCRNASLRVAADTKFWLWVNGKPVAWEGGLKRGPSPQAGYCDVIDLSTAPWGAGPSTVAVLVLYLGRRTVRTIRFGIPRGGLTLIERQVSQDTSPTQVLGGSANFQRQCYLPPVAS